MRHLYLAVALCCFFACVPDNDPQVPTQPVCTDPPVLTDAELSTACGKAFVILRDLQCDEVCAGGEKGDSFMSLCERFEMDPMSNFDTKCIMTHSESRESIRKCPAIRCR